MAKKVFVRTPKDCVAIAKTLIQPGIRIFTGNSKNSKLLRNKTPRPKPLLHNEAAGTQNKSDGELYYTVANGVRLSGVATFSEPLSAEQAWRLVLFIRHSPQITAEELNEMTGLNPKSQSNPANW